MYPYICCAVALTVDVSGNGGDSSESDDEEASMPHWVDSCTPNIVFSGTHFVSGG